jgi:hypothetical protein
VGQGLVSSLARPGGNFTGYTNFEFSIGGKWVELARPVAPRIKRIAYIFDPNTAPYIELFMPAIVAASASHALDLTWIQVRDEPEIEQMVTAFGREPRGAALIVGADIFTALHRERIALLAAQSGLPRSIRGRRAPQLAVWYPTGLKAPTSPATGRVPRPYSQGSTTRRPAGGTTQQVRAGD